MATETTLILLKPDCVSKGLCGEVIGRLESQEFRIRGIKMLRMNDELLREHYAHIADLPFFPDIVAFMTQTPIIALAVEGENAVKRFRELLGPTDSTKAEKGTIRGDHGVDMMTNIAHASDSPENARIELDRFFDAAEIFDY